MDKIDFELHRTILGIKSEAQRQIDEELQARMGGAALSNSGIAIEQIQTHHDIKTARQNLAQESEDAMRREKKKEIIENETLVRSVTELLPNGNARLVPGEYGGNTASAILRDKFYPWDLITNLQFPTDSLIEAKRAQSSLLWVSFPVKSDIFNEQTPPLPYYVVGHRSGEVTDDVLVAPANLYLRTHRREWGSININGKDCAFMDEKSGRVKKRVESGRTTHPAMKANRHYPSDIFRLTISKEDHKKITEHQDYQYSDYRPDEVEALYDPDQKAIVIGPNSPGSLRVTRKRLLRRGGDQPDEIFFTDHVEMTKLDNQVIERFKTVEHLVDLALLFGKGKEMDKILAERAQ